MAAMPSLGTVGCSSEETAPFETLPAITAPADEEGAGAGCVGCDLQASISESPERFGRWGRPVPGLTAAAYDFNGNFWADAVGSEDPNGERPMTTSTKLRISSASKQFASILFLRLRADGFRNPTTGEIIDFDDPLSDYGCDNPVNGLCGWGLSEFNPESATNPIRLRHLAGNTSGIPKVLDKDPDFVLRHMFFGSARQSRPRR
jgi:CubicO group peptidase (beta-lactamase class C family)